MKSSGRRAGFSMIELLTAIGVLSILGSGVVVFILRYPIALQRIEERQAAVMLLDSKVEKARYLISLGIVGPGKTKLPLGKPPGGIAEATCSMTVSPCREPGFPAGLNKVVVELTWKGQKGRPATLARSLLVQWWQPGGADAR